MKRIKVKCGEATLIAPYWLENLWPSDFPAARWPTFCGAGDGWGDKIVPDWISGVCISPACFLHDVGWATTKDSIDAFFTENWYFALNIRALILSSKIKWWEKELAVLRAWSLYFVAVSTVGAFAFDPLSEDWANPLNNPIVKDRLKRLSLARILYEPC